MTLRNHGAAYRLLLGLALGVSVRGAPEPADSKGPPIPPALPPQPALPPFLAPPATADTTAPAAEQPVPKPRPKISNRIAGQIVASIPAWTPPPPRPAEKAPTPPPDPNVVQMAPVYVKDYRLPRIEEEDWLTRKARDAELVKEYITPFDRYFLNRFTLPLFGMPQAARARMMYEEDKRLRDLRWISDEIDQMKRLDPEAAKELKIIRNNTFMRPGD
jgi:hypothetical protein